MMGADPTHTNMRIDWPPEQWALITAAATDANLGPYLFVRAVVLGAITNGSAPRAVDHAIETKQVTARRLIRRGSEVLRWRCVTRGEHWTTTVETHTFDLIRQGTGGQHAKPGDGWYLFAPDVMSEPRYFGGDVITAKRDADAFILRTVRSVQNGETDVPSD